MNPNSSTEVSIRSDIVRDFEFASERARRLQEEKKIKKRLRPSASLLEREDYQAAIQLIGDKDKSRAESSLHRSTSPTGLGGLGGSMKQMKKSRGGRQFRLSEQNIFYNRPVEVKSNVELVSENHQLQEQTKQRVDDLQHELNEARRDLFQMSKTQAEGFQMRMSLKEFGANDEIDLGASPIKKAPGELTSHSRVDSVLDHLANMPLHESANIKSGTIRLSQVRRGSDPGQNSSSQHYSRSRAANKDLDGRSTEEKVRSSSKGIQLGNKPSNMV